MLACAAAFPYERGMSTLADRLLRSLQPTADGELLVIVGETASGKTPLALEIARRVGGEVIGADSVQVYRGFDVGSGKPTRDELAGVPHALIDVAGPLEAFDAGRFISLADEAIAAAHAAGRVPIVCGGTFLWVRALIFGLAQAPSAPPEVRAALQADVAREGSPALHARLAAVDPSSASRLHPNDAVRIVRALEVHQTTGKTLSAWQSEHGFRTVRHRARLVAIAHEREAIEARIARRVDAMLAAGWIDEVEALIAKGYGEARAMSAVGYAQVRAHVRGELPREELATQITRATRIFARRQRTWLRGAEVEWLPANGAASLDSIG